MQFSEPILNEDEYKKLVIDSVEGYIPHVQHNIIVCEEDNKKVAVFNWFIYGVDTIFLHRCWFFPEFKSRIMKLKYWVGFCNFVKGKGYRYIMGVIDSHNTPALIWALKTGFIIVGIRLSIDNQLIVDIVKDLKEEG